MSPPSLQFSLKQSKVLAVAVLLSLAVLPVRAIADDCGFIGKMIGTCAAVSVADDRIGQALEILQKEIQDTREVAERAANAALRAIPGERYLQLIDDLNGPNLEQREAARSFLRNLANVEPGQAFEGTLSFDGPKDFSFKYDVFRAIAPHPYYVEVFAKNSMSLQSTNASVLPIATREKIENDVRKSVSQALSHLIGRRVELRNDVTGQTLTGLNFNNMQTGATHKWFIRYPDTLTTGWKSDAFLHPNRTSEVEKRNAQFDEELKRNEQRKEDFVNNVTNAILAVTHANELAAHGESRTMHWNPVDAEQYMIVVIDEQTYEAMQADSNAAILASVHKAGDASSTLNGRPGYRFSGIDFDSERNPHVTGKNGQKVYWAFHEFSGSPRIDNEMLLLISELRDSLSAWEEEKGTLIDGVATKE